jgi:hypothetical protein
MEGAVGVCGSTADGRFIMRIDYSRHPPKEKPPD